MTLCVNFINDLFYCKRSGVNRKRSRRLNLSKLADTTVNGNVSKMQMLS